MVVTKDYCIESERVCVSIVPRLEVRLAIVLREEETGPELCELLLSFLTETKQKLTTPSRILDLVGFRHHETRLGMDAR